MTSYIHYRQNKLQTKIDEKRKRKLLYNDKGVNNINKI